MRWENLTVKSGSGPADAALFGADAVTIRTFDSPEFRGITFQRSGPVRSSTGCRGPHACPSSGR